MKNLDRPTLILAVILAIFLWAYVRIAQETPTARRLIVRIPVELVGVANGIKASLYPDHRFINVYIKGRPDAVNSVLPDEVTAQVDLSDVKKPATVHRQVKVVLNTLEKVRPDGKPPVVTIIAEAFGQKTFPVTVSFVVSPPPGRPVSEYLVKPNTVTVEGTTDALQRVKYVIVPIVPGMPGSDVLEVPPRAVNERGERVDGVQVLQGSVEVCLASGRGPTGTRAVAVRPPALLRQPRRLIVSVAKVRPDQVTLSGEAALLERQPAYLETEPIDVRNVARDTTLTVRLRVPLGLTVVEGPTVRVDLEVQSAQP